MGPVAAAAAGSAIESGVASAFNAWQAEIGRDYNREMASTAHQREVKDMLKAGLNPILSASKHGASVAPSPVAHAVESRATASALQARQIQQQERLVDAQVNDINSAARLKQVEAQEKMMSQSDRMGTIRETLNNLVKQGQMTDAQKKKVEKEILKVEAETNLVKLHGKHSALGLNQAEAESEFYESSGQMSKWLEMLRMLGINPSAITGILFILQRKGKGSPKLNIRPREKDSDGWKKFKKDYKKPKDPNDPMGIGWD